MYEKKIYIFTTIFVALLSWSPSQALADFSDNFDSYTSGSYVETQTVLWESVSDNDGMITNTESVSSPNSVYNVGDSSIIWRSIGDLTSETFLTATVSFMHNDGTPTFTNTDLLYLWDDDNNQEMCAIRFDNSAVITFDPVASTTSTLGTATPNVWYEVSLEMDMLNDLCRASLNGSYTAWKPSNTSYVFDSSNQNLRLRTHSSMDNVYFDDVSLTSGTQEVSGNSRVYSINSPSTDANIPTPDNTVDFDIDYVSSYPVIDYVCVELSNMTTYQSLTPLCEDTLSSGFLNFSTTTTLINQNTYQWRFVLRDSNNQIIDSTQNYFFSVTALPGSPYDPTDSGNPFVIIPQGATSSTALGDLTLECDPEDTFFSRSVCNLAILLFVPSTGSIQQLLTRVDQLTDKQPFSSFYELKSAWSSTTDSQNIEYTTVSLTFYGEQIPVISTTTIVMFAGEEGLLTLRYIISVALWISLAMYMVSRAKQLF